MTRTIDDLRQTLEAHSRALPLSEPRAVAVHGRIRRVQRQRVAAGAAAVLMVAVVGTLAVRTTTRPGEHVGTPSLPEYAEGGRLVAALSVDGSASAGASTTVVPTSSSLIFASSPCTGPGATEGSAFVGFAVDGKDAGGGSCISGSSTTVSAGLTAGRPVKIRVWLAAHLGMVQPHTTREEAQIVARTHVWAGVYVPVPRSQYVFPPRPRHVESLSEFGNPGVVLRQRGSASRVTTVGVSTGLRLEIDAVEPGVVTAELDGKVVATASTWDYRLYSTLVDLSTQELAADGITGDTAQLTLHESGFADASGAWQALVGSPIVGGAPASGAAP